MVRIPEVNDPEHPNVTHPFAGMNDRVADKISTVFGSMAMFWALMVWQLTWITLATLSIWVFKQDRYPFSFLLFLGNLVQLWSLPILGTAQNRADDKRNAKAQADHDALTYIAQKVDDICGLLNAQAAEGSLTPDKPSQ